MSENSSKNISLWFFSALYEVCIPSNSLLTVEHIMINHVDFDIICRYSF